jgi:hypothetical protein
MKWDSSHGLTQENQFSPQQLQAELRASHKRGETFNIHKEINGWHVREDQLGKVSIAGARKGLL